MVIPLVIAGSAGILFEYRTLFGRDAGVALLTIFMALKLLELRTQRDAIVVVMLGYFLLLTHYFYADEIWVGFWMLLSMAITTSALIRLQAPTSHSTKETLGLATLMIFQAVPIMVILFLLFPRISGPLWGLPQDTRRAISGLGNEISPGSISELSQSSAIAFRVEFESLDSQLPARDKLYWRGPVMTDYDGMVWRVARNYTTPVTPETQSISVLGASVNYWMMMEPHQQHWLLALDIPITTPGDSRINRMFSLLSKTPIRDRQRYALTSSTEYRIGIKESADVLNRSMALPDNINPKSRALAARWRAQSTSPRVIAAKALQLFQQDAFVYTLRPPLLGQNAVDDFLFINKRGFCEHYASAFVFLMRAAGLPARIVAGYQGGEINPIDKHLIVRQSDAHAWAEIWIEKEGWVRIDPTAAIAPNRIEQGLQASLPEGEPLPAMLRAELDWLRTLRYRWDAVNNAWNLWVLAYNAERQGQILRNLGLGDDWRILIGLLSSIGGLALLAIAAWILHRKKPSDPLQRLWRRLCLHLSREGIPRASWEGPQTYLERVATTRPDLAPLAKSVADLYIPLRYGIADRASFERLRDIIRSIPRFSFRLDSH